MSNQASRWGLTVLTSVSLVLALTSCVTSTAEHVYPTAAPRLAVSPDSDLGKTLRTVETPTSSNQSEPAIEAVGRAFLPRGEDVDPEIGFAAFLLFPKRLSSNLAHRKAAAAAFLCVFDRASDLEGLVSPNRVAVLFAPVLNGTSAVEASGQRNIDALLEAYDYARAEQMAKSLELDIADVYLVGVMPPYPFDEAALTRDRTLIMDLSDKPPAAVEAAMLRLDSQFSYAAWHVVADDEHPIANFARTLFASLGTLISAPGARAEEPAPCM